MGQLIEFYRPLLKPPVAPQPAPEVAAEPNISASDILRELLGKGEEFQDVVVMYRDRRGELGVVSSLEMGDIVLFVEVIQQEMVTRFRASLSAPPKGGGDDR